MGFREALASWTDADAAMHMLARSLGVVAQNSTTREVKWIYWSNNPLGEFLYRMLNELVLLGALEKRDEPDLQFRWREGFEPPVPTVPATAGDDPV